MASRLLIGTHLGLLGALLIVAGGCGGPKTADVMGVVTLNGKPVVTGSVVFHCGYTSPPVVVAIGPDGKYVAKGVAIGAVKVGVNSPNPKAEVDEMRAMAKGKPTSGTDAPTSGPPPGWFAIPSNYADPERSGLTHFVPPGSSEFNIDLK